MTIDWTDTTVLAALIQAIGTVGATIIAALSAALIGKRWADRQRLERALSTALGDIQFLLAVEQAHCDLHVAATKQSNKRRVRAVVQAHGHVWSGRFTPGRVKNGKPSAILGGLLDGLKAQWAAKHESRERADGAVAVPVDTLREGVAQ